MKTLPAGLVQFAPVNPEEPSWFLVVGPFVWGRAFGTWPDAVTEAFAHAKKAGLKVGSDPWIIYRQTKAEIGSRPAESLNDQNGPYVNGYGGICYYGKSPTPIAHKPRGRRVVGSGAPVSSL